MKKFIFLLVCFFFGIGSSFALSIDCPKVLSPGEEFSIYIKDNNYNGFKIKYDFDENFSYKGIVSNKYFKKYYDSNLGFSGSSLFNEDLKLELRMLASKDIGINEKYNLNFIDIEASDKDYKYVKVNDITCSVNVVSDVNTLKSLKVDGVSLSPKFSSSVLSYKGVTKKDEISISAVLSDNSAKISGDIGKKKLKVGSNTFKIMVTSARGSVRTYKIYITRESKSNDVTLKSLKLSSGNLDFKKNIFLYSVDVNNEVETIDVVATASSSKASVKVHKPEILAVGENVIDIDVTAEDGSVATYTLIVNRKEKLSNDASIKSLVIKGYGLEFMSDIYNYNLKILDEDKLDIEVILSDAKARYDIVGNSELKNNSVIEIKVIAQDGSSNVYKINIKNNDKKNSSSIINYFELLPVICIVLVILVILVIKIIKVKFLKVDK